MCKKCRGIPVQSSSVFYSSPRYYGIVTREGQADCAELPILHICLSHIMKNESLQEAVSNNEIDNLFSCILIVYSLLY